MLKKLHIFLIKSFLGPFLMTFVISLFILLMQFLWVYIDDLVGKGLEWYIIAKLLFFTSASLVPLALPISILLSSVMTFGNLGEHYELVAIKSSGISLKEFIKPLIGLIIIISFGAFIFSNYILPYTNLKSRSLLYDVRKQRPALNIKESVFYNGLDNYSILINSKNKETEELFGIKIYEHKSYHGNTRVITAESGKMNITSDNKYLVFTLNNGWVFEEELESKDGMITRPHKKVKFTNEMIRFDLSEFQLNRTNQELFKKNYHMQNLSQLSFASDSLNEVIKQKKVQLKNELFKYYDIAKRKKNPHIIEIDSIKSSEIKDLINDTSKYKNIFTLDLQKKEQIKLIESAQTFSDNARKIAYSNNEEIISRKVFIAKHDIEWHKKLTLSFACFILFLIGAPLGAIIRKGGLGLPVVVSVVCFLIFHLLSISAEKFIKELIIPPIGMWAPSIILLPIGIFLTIKASNDSQLLNIDSYIIFIKKIFSRLSKK